MSPGQWYGRWCDGLGAQQDTCKAEVSKRKVNLQLSVLEGSVDVVVDAIDMVVVEGGGGVVVVVVGGGGVVVVGGGVVVVGGGVVVVVVVDGGGVVVVVVVLDVISEVSLVVDESIVVVDDVSDILQTSGPDAYVEANMQVIMPMSRSQS